MSWYEHNIKGLKQFRNNIFEEINKSPKKIDSSDNQIEQVTSETAINGEKFLVIQKSGKIYRLNSMYSPTHEAEIWAQQYATNNLNNVITMFGMGNGIFARGLMNNLRENDFLFIYEPSLEIFTHVLENYDIHDILINKNIILTIEGINDFEFHNLLQNAMHITNLKSQIRCSHPYYEELFEESCVKYWKELKDNMVHTKININTEILFGRRLIINTFQNSKYIKNSLTLDDLIPDINQEIPAIIVAAGPSLKENLEELKRAKGKAYIFVVDRILDYILDNGVIPDFVVTIDPIKPVEYFTNREDVKIPLLCELVSNWEVLDQHKGRKIFYNSSPYFQKMYQFAGKKPPSLITGTSVATAAFACCIKLGFKKIVLVGQDLAYDGDFTHAGGIAEKFDSNDIMVEGIDGKPVRSRFDWYDFLIWFKDIIILNPGITVYDTKKKGAKIQGTVLMPLTEIIDTYCTQDTNITEIIESKKSSFSTQDDLNKVKRYFENSCTDMYQLKSKAKEAIKICEEQIRAYSKNNNDTALTIKNFNRISKINKFINKKPTYQLLDSFITSLTANQLAEMYKFTDNDDRNKIDTYEKSKKIYEAIVEGIDFAEPLLKEAISNFDN